MHQHGFLTAETKALFRSASATIVRHGVALAQRVGQDLHGIASRLGRAPAVGAAAGRGPDASRLSSILARAESGLADDVLPFWVREIWDEDAGGFITHLDRTGHRSGPTSKCLVTQAGTIWALAAAHRHGLDSRGYLELARRGVRFLLEKMWDAEHGGFVWEVERNGRLAEPRKDTCGHAIAIYALTEYAMASGDEEALATASAVFDLLHERAGDGPLGFREAFTRDWTPALGPRGERKTLLTHLHLMAAFTLLSRASHTSAHSAALEKVVTLLLGEIIHPAHRCGTETFDRSWRPLGLGFGRTVTSYGLNVEAAWLMFDAADELGSPPERVRAIALDLIDHALAYGFDWQRGGLARYGPPRGHVARAVYLDPRRLVKVWWAQAELLVATIEAHRLTGAASYLDAFQKQFDWIWTRQADREAGGWFEATTWREGHPLGFGKGNDWRCPFHETRALIRVSRALRAMGIR
jgi:mannose/cellobiose epimerase-like protein (N-acyl-D-glucosamine 2-epimerase family)